MPEAFAGDKKTGQSLLGPIERRFIDWAVPKVPGRVMSHHLTALTAVWSSATVLFGWLSTSSRYCSTARSQSPSCSAICACRALL